MPKPSNSAPTIGFESELWRAAEYKHIVRGPIFLKYVPDAFEEYHAQLLTEVAQGADPKDPDEYRAVNISWIPREAYWSHL